MPKWITSKIVDIIERTETTKSFFLQMPELTNFNFIPGQFVTLDLPISDKRQDRWRSYSIANAPNGSNIIELVIVKVPFGKATTYLFEEMQIDSEIIFKGPGGVFCLPKEIKKEIVMICTGTGVAPFRSMINHIYNHKLDHQKLHLIFGARKRSNILYEDEWKKLTEQNPSLRVDYALSREEFEGYQGYVHGIYQRDYSNLAKDRVFYLCGWQNMVDEAKKGLLNLGYEESQIIEELYG